MIDLKTPIKSRLRRAGRAIGKKYFTECILVFCFGLVVTSVLMFYTVDVHTLVLLCLLFLLLLIVFVLLFKYRKNIIEGNYFFKQAAEKELTVLEDAKQGASQELDRAVNKIQDNEMFAGSRVRYVVQEAAQELRAYAVAEKLKKRRGYENQVQPMFRSKKQERFLSAVILKSSGDEKKAQELLKSLAYSTEFLTDKFIEELCNKMIVDLEEPFRKNKLRVLDRILKYINDAREEQKIIKSFC